MVVLPTAGGPSTHSLIGYKNNIINNFIIMINRRGRVYALTKRPLVFLNSLTTVRMFSIRPVYYNYSNNTFSLWLYIIIQIATLSTYVPLPSTRTSLSPWHKLLPSSNLPWGGRNDIAERRRNSMDETILQYSQCTRILQKCLWSGMRPPWAVSVSSQCQGFCTQPYIEWKVQRLN